MTRKCKRCSSSFERGKRNRDAWCSSCEQATADQTLYALVFVDRSGLYNLYETLAEAGAVMKQDSEAAGVSRLSMKRCVGQKGARELLTFADDPNADYWDRAEAAWDRADFERSQ